MQANRDENNPNGTIPPQIAGYPYQPMVPGQITMYPAPPGAYRANSVPVDELSSAFAGMKPVYQSGMPSIPGMPGMPTMTPVAYPDGRTMYQTQAPVQAMQHNQYMVPQPMVTPYNVTSAPAYMWNRPAREGSDMPPLARRNSISSNEEAGPQTPFVGGQFAVEQYKKNAAVGYASPEQWTTPSPYSLTYGTSMPQQLWKHEGEYQPCDYEAICAQEPVVPRPVPAIFSSEKSRGTLDKCLKNDTNTTNVYIRGLHPNTTDDMLHGYGARFGPIMSAKSMLDQGSGACKGFGFIKYHNFDDGENCIRGFFQLGYEAKWARVSHNERLKTLSDECNTNLYISNLPMSFNEQMLTSTFGDYEVMSAKILRDENGISRGVGFARFSTPTICAEVIAKYNNFPVMDGYNLSIRFADTPEQKKLKSLTAERRQFKTHEYNTAAYGPGSPYAATVSPTAGNFPSPVTGRFPPSPYAAYAPAPVPGYPGAALPVAARPVENLVPASVQAHNAAIKAESPSVAAQTKRLVVQPRKIKQEATDSEEDSEEEITTPLKNVTNTVKRKISPSKSAISGGSPAPRSTLEGVVRSSPSKTPSKNPRTKLS